MKGGCKIGAKIAHESGEKELLVAYSQTRRTYAERNSRKMVLALALFSTVQ